MKYIVLLFVLLMCLSGCSKDTIDNQMTDTTENQSIIMYDNQSALILLKDAAFIKSSSVTESILTMRVEYGGGCKEHTFALYGYSMFLESNPPQAEIYLSHNGNGDMCKALLNKDVSFNLLPLLNSCRKQYGSGQILLRIHEPDGTNPVTPFISVPF